MNGQLIQHAHRPPHIYNDDTLYFITTSTYKNAHYLKSATHKTNLRQEMMNLAPEYGITIEAWVILNNHYHLLFHLKQAEHLALFFKRLHGRTATAFNRQDQATGRTFWYGYWDRCIRSDRDYWTRFNYLHYNPIKHGYVQNLRDWPFSSLHTYLEANGLDWLNDCWRSYPIKEFEVEHDEF